MISNEEINDIMKIVQALDDSNILLEENAKRIESEAKQQKRGFLGLLLGTLGASLLGNMSTGKELVMGFQSKNFFVTTPSFHKLYLNNKGWGICNRCS